MHTRALCLAALAAAPIASGDVVYDESVDGDLSGDRLNPTVLPALGVGVHTLAATSILDDIEYVTLTIQAGLTLDAIVLDTYVSQSEQSFIAVQAGAVFTEAPDTVDVANLLGWTHFGTGPGQVGPDILDDIGSGPGAIGFAGPLGAGDYTFWIQEVAPVSASYELSFVVTPAPAGVLALGAGLAPLARRRR